jgi:hypothetical protein
MMPPAKPNTNTIACGSCGGANAPDMSFCLACGKVLSARMTALRKARGVKKRECTSCKRADELNNRYCIFCGAEIQKRQLSQGNSAALEKFTQEISGVQDRFGLMEKVEAGGKNGVPSRPVKQVSPAVSVALYMALAVLSAVGVAALTKVNFARTFFTLTSPIKNGLVMYTKQPYVDVVLESEDKKRYLLGSTGKSGSLAVSDIDSGSYLARFSKEGFETVSQAIDVDKGRINLLGFDSPVELPKSFVETAPK